METNNSAILAAGPPLVPEKFSALLEAEVAACARRERAAPPARLSDAEMAERLHRAEEELVLLRKQVHRLESEWSRAIAAETEALRTQLREMGAQPGPGAGLAERRKDADSPRACGF